jgi:hypothetical protein
MTFLGIIIILVCIALLWADPILERMTKDSRNPVDLIKDNRKWMIWGTMVLSLVLIFNPFVYNSDGERTYVQDPILGTEKVVFEPGYHWGGFFHRSTEWPDVMTTDLENIPIRFNDATQATAEATVRWQLPNNELDMIALHKAYRSDSKLQSRTLTPYSRECLAFSSQLMELV